MKKKNERDEIRENKKKYQQKLKTKSNPSSKSRWMNTQKKSQTLEFLSHKFISILWVFLSV